MRVGQRPVSEVVVTGLGFATCIGSSRNDVLHALAELETGLRPWEFGIANGLGVRVAGTPVGFVLDSENPAEWSWPKVDIGAGDVAFDPDPALVRSLPPHGLPALWAATHALREAGLALADIEDGCTGLFTASGGSARLLRHHLDGLAASGWRRCHPLGVLRSVAGTLHFNLVPALGIRGASGGFVSACTSGSHALGHAIDEIRLGRQQRMIVVAGEDLSPESLLPFAAMNALSPQVDPRLASRPFDRDRDGFVGAGGAAALVLENAEVAGARGAAVQARILGWGQASDGHHPVYPEPEGRGIEAAIRRALDDAGVFESAIGYVNAHATSTPSGDAAEAAALRRIFTEADRNTDNGPAISSTKALTGHGLSFAGALEAAVCVLAVSEGLIPGQAHLLTPGPECAGLRIPTHTTRANPDIVLNCSSGFGGANVCHVIAAPLAK